jgi:hypothetical protein
MTKRHTLLDISGHLTPEPRVHYINHTFDVGPEASRVGLVLTFHKEKLAQIFVSLHDPARFRGNRMNPGARGDITLELWAAPDDSSEGGIAGALPAGPWRVQIDVEQLGESTDYRLLAYAEYEAVPPALTWDFPDDHVVRHEAGWYQGELHAHSTESDGKYPVDTVVRAAVATGLDFFALTDHFTTSQWRKLVPHLEQPIALLRSTEITSHQGHANLHGMQDWVDVYVDRDGWSMNQAAAAIHAQNGLFCVNHPFSGSLGWRAYDFDWANADLIEIYHNLEGGNNAYQIALWDRLLNQGHRIVGVAGIDSHDPFEGFHRLGQLVTWVYADHLSEAGIVAGLKRGRVYVSKGPELRFTAHSGGQSAEMWESLPPGAITLDVAVRADEDLRLYVLRDGLPFDSVPVTRTHGRWTTLTFHDQARQRAYYRVELHSQYHDPAFPYLRWRDHTTMRALSNPIWVG